MWLGTLKLHESAEAETLVEEALKHGWGVDTADVYGRGEPHDAERRIPAGRVQTKVGLVRRGKRWIPEVRTKQLEAAARRSLAITGARSLLLHAWDPSQGPTSPWRVLQRLRDEGLVDTIGICNPRYADVTALLESGVDVVQLALSPFDLTALESGLVRLCRSHGIPVQAHSPLGGWRRKSRAARPLRPIAREFGVSAERLTLAWLASMDIEPVVGCTRLDTFRDNLTPCPDEAVEVARAAIPETYLASETPRNGTVGDVVLLMGRPGAGKSTAARPYIDSDYERLNRDALGGTLSGIIKRLDGLLSAGTTRVVLDNTWPSRHLRSRVREVAARHGLRARTVYVPTSIEQCQVQVVRRILADGRGLPGPEHLTGKDPVHWFGPEVHFRFERQFEPPTADEGLPLEVADTPTLEWGDGEGVIASLEALESRAFSEPVYAAVWLPDADRRKRFDVVAPTAADVRFCPHPPGPPRCWCRKPLPGMVVDLLLTHGLNPRATTMVGGSAERTIADRLGMRFERVKA